VSEERFDAASASLKERGSHVVEPGWLEEVSKFDG